MIALTTRLNGRAIGSIEIIRYGDPWPRLVAEVLHALEVTA